MGNRRMANGLLAPTQREQSSSVRDSGSTKVASCLGNEIESGWVTMTLAAPSTKGQGRV